LLILAAYACTVYLIGTVVAASLPIRILAYLLWAITIPLVVLFVSFYMYQVLIPTLPLLCNDITMLSIGVSALLFASSYGAQRYRVRLHAYEQKYVSDIFERGALIIGLSWFMSSVWKLPYNYIALTWYAVMIFCIGFTASRRSWLYSSYGIALFNVLTIYLQYHFIIYHQPWYIIHMLFGSCAIATIIAYLLFERFHKHITEYESQTRLALKALIPASLFVWGRAGIMSYAAQQESSLMRREIEQTLLTIYYGLFAIITIGVGLIKREWALRYFGIGLIAVSLGKLWFIIMGISDTIHRMVAFLLVGILVIIALFIYQRLSKQLD